MSSAERSQLVAGVWITSLGTLASRLLGLVRDMATAALFGLSGGGVMDAFVVAFRIPNLFRRLFGEGALAASYLPVLSVRLDTNRTAAWQLASVMLVWLAVVLAGVVVVAEGICVGVWRLYGDVPGMPLLTGLTAVMLPYLFFICLAAQVSGTLHALAHYGAPALAPTLLNICWLAAVWLVAPRMAPDKEAQAYVLAGSIVVAGVLQLAVQVPTLRRLGFRFDYNWPASRDAVRRIVRSMGPMMVGLAATQINTFLDSLLAWGLAAPPAGPKRIDWLGGVRYPLEQGAAAAIYYGERLYQFPLGLVGLAVATAIFPALSRHAARGQLDRLGKDLTLGLRLVLFFGVPASAGLLLLAGPLATLFLERGEFTPADTARVARTIACYGLGVWAFCALAVIVRGYYAAGDHSTPLRVGAVAVVVNLALNLALVWPLAEAGLALATSLAAALQVVVLVRAIRRGASALGSDELRRCGVRTVLATVAMLAAGYAALGLLPSGPAAGERLARVLVPLVAGGLVFLVASRLLGASEWRLLMGRRGGIEID